MWRAAQENNTPLDVSKGAGSRGWFLLVLALLPGQADAACPADQLAAGSHLLRMEFQDLPRSYWVHIPKGYDPEVETPVIVDLHFIWGSGLLQETVTGLRDRADEQNFIVVQPNGFSVIPKIFPMVGGLWNGGPECCGAARDRDIDDVGFVREIIDRLETGHACVDRERIHAVGLSSGSGMALRLACDASDLFASAAGVGGGLSSDAVLEEYRSLCQPTTPRPIWLFSGEHDPRRYRVAQTAEFWATEVSGCSDPPVEIRPAEGVRCMAHSAGGGCAASVVYCVGLGTAHCWPSPAVPLLPCFAPHDFEATEEILEFFDSGERYVEATRERSELRDAH